MGRIISVPITKAGKGVTMDIDTDDLNGMFESNDQMMEYLIAEGLKTVLNSRSSKLAAPSKLEGKALEDNKEAALAQATKNLEDLAAGKLSKKSSAKTAGVDRAVMTEAVRLAKNVVKDQCRAAKIPLSTVPAKDITDLAKKMVEQDAQFITEAKANIEARGKVEVALNIAELIHQDPKLVAKAEKEKADRKAERQLSAKQAGKPEKRAGKAPPRRPDTSVSNTAH